MMAITGKAKMKNPGGILIGCALCLLSIQVFAEDVEATLAWSKRMEVSTLVSGMVKEVLVKPGSYLDKGDVLLRLDPRLFEARLARAEANLARTRVVRDEAKRELERSEELFDRTVISTHELDLAKIEFTKADADYKAALSEQELAKINMEFSVVNAPFDSVVIQSLIRPGQALVNKLQAKTLFIIAEANAMNVSAPIGMNKLGSLSIGQKLGVNVNGKHYDALIVSIGLEPLPDTDKYMLEARFNVPKGLQLRAGQEATISLP